MLSSRLQYVDVRPSCAIWACFGNVIWLCIGWLSASMCIGLVVCAKKVSLWMEVLVAVANMFSGVVGCFWYGIDICRVDMWIKRSMRSLDPSFQYDIRYVKAILWSKVW